MDKRQVGREEEMETRRVAVTPKLIYFSRVTPLGHEADFPRRKKNLPTIFAHHRFGDVGRQKISGSSLLFFFFFLYFFFLLYFFFAKNFSIKRLKLVTASLDGFHLTPIFNNPNKINGTTSVGRSTDRNKVPPDNVALCLLVVFTYLLKTSFKKKFRMYINTHMLKYRF